MWGVSVEELRSAISAAREVGGHFAICMLKTYVNAWCTSKRLGHRSLESQTCLFCNSAADSLPHMLECASFRIMIDNSLVAAIRDKKSYAHEYIGMPPLHIREWLGFDAPSVSSHLLRASFAFHAYHALKAKELRKLGGAEITQKAIEEAKFLFSRISLRKLICPQRAANSECPGVFEKSGDVHHSVPESCSSGKRRLDNDAGRGNGLLHGSAGGSSRCPGPRALHSDQLNAGPSAPYQSESATSSSTHFPITSSCLQ